LREYPSEPAAAARRRRTAPPAPPAGVPAQSVDSGIARQCSARCAAPPALSRSSFQTAAFQSSRLTQQELQRKKGWLFHQPLCVTQFLWFGLWRLALTAAATGCPPPTFPLICFGLASSRFGIVSANPPLW